MADAKITISATDLASDVFKRVSDAMKETGAGADSLGEHLKASIEDPMQAVRDGATSVLESMGSFGEVLLGAGTVAGAVGFALFELADHAIAAGEAIQDFSYKTSISVEAASALDYTAKVAGSSLDQMGAAVFMMQKRMEDDATGNFAAALGKIHLTVSEIQALAPDQQFLKIAEAFRENTTQSDRASVSMALFGRAGRDLAPLLMKDLSDLTEQAKDLGHVLSAEDAKGAEDLAVAWRGFKESISWMSTEVGFGVVHFFENVVSGINQAMYVLDPFSADMAVLGKRIEGTLPAVKDIMGALVMGQGGVALSAGEATAAEKELEAEHKLIAEAQKKAADEAKRWSDLLFEIGTVGASTQLTIAALSDSVVEGTKFYLENGVAVEKIAKLYGITREQVDAVRQSTKDAATELAEHFKAIADSEREGEQGAAAVIRGLAGMKFELMNLSVAMGDTVMASRMWNGEMALMPDLSDQAADHMKRVTEAGETFRQAITRGMGDAAQVTEQFSGRLASLATLALKTGDDVMNALGHGDIFGAVTAGAVGAIKALKDLFGGVSAVELEGRKVEASFESSFGGFDKMMAAIGAAYAATGRGADQAQADVAALMAAEKNGGAGVQAMIDHINLAFADQKTKAADVSTAVNDILAAAKTVGGAFPDAMKPLVLQLEALPGLTSDETKAIEDMLNGGQGNFSNLVSAASKYGLSLDELGGKAAQLSISHEADQIESDYKTLVTDSGADSDKVLAGMKTSLTALVNHAMDAGAVLPTALQPLVDQLFNTGQLTDGAGSKITDLSKLKFDDTGDPLATGMKSLTDAINHLGDLLSPAGLPKIATDAASAIGSALGAIKAPEIDLHYRYIADNDAPGASSYASMGGLVTSRGVVYAAEGWMQPKGTDTVPAMLTPGERVLSVPQTQALDRAGGLSALHGGEMGIAALEREMKALHGTIKRLANKLELQGLLLPRQIAAAVR